MTNEHLIPLITDAAPKLDEHGLWISQTITAKLDDPLLSWVGHESMSILVYRFTIIRQDGSKVVVYQQTPMVQPFMKAGLRQFLKSQ